MFHILQWNLKALNNFRRSEVNINNMHEIQNNTFVYIFIVIYFKKRFKTLGDREIDRQSYVINTFPLSYKLFKNTFRNDIGGMWLL